MTEAEKSQTIRLADVFLIGPFMIASARYLPSSGARMTMFALGVATIVYNGQNYLKNEGVL